MPITLKRGPDGEAITNVPYHISTGDLPTDGAPPFEWGHSGFGPRELAMNILYFCGVPEAEAKTFANDFAIEILTGIPPEGATIPDKIVEDWTAMRRLRKA